jgi:ribosomal protein S18 acetylase RimI-like enzyme
MRSDINAVTHDRRRRFVTAVMHTEFRRALLPQELRSLVLFDHKAFSQYPADWFARDDWNAYETWWMIIDKRKVGCCAFAPHGDFQEDLGRGGWHSPLQDSLYIATTGILPAWRRLGFGTLLKCWQISYARHHGFTRLVTNTRKSNQAMIGLNKKFGFKVIRSLPNYYADPGEPALVMELRL